jgi:FlaA1/EpsC-like NDP-sugar epimerase
MRQKFPDGNRSPMRYFLGDVRDSERLQRAFVDVDFSFPALSAFSNRGGKESEP